MGNRGNAYLSYGSSFTPLAIAACKLWLDANDITTITKDGSDLVSQWNDKSTEANVLVQATGSFKPKWFSAIQNGKDIIRFDGVADYITDAATNTYSQPSTLFIVCTSPTEDIALNKGMFDGVSNRNLFNLQTTGVGYRVYANTGLVGGTRQTSAKIFRVVFNGGSSSLHINGSSILSGAAGADSLSGIILGAFTTGANGWADYDVCEVIFYNAILSAGDITLVENYLTSKWGL